LEAARTPSLDAVTASRERCKLRGIGYVPSDRPASDLYRDLLPVLNAGRVELLDNPKLLAQLVSTGRTGRDIISHPLDARRPWRAPHFAISWILSRCRPLFVPARET
jgi:hypothetical protein